jgi:hypothetical protein
MKKERDPKWGGETRAADGCITTFQLEDGTIHVERFSQLVFSTQGYARVMEKVGAPFIEQAAARADELGARIVSISTPATIWRDLQGTRAQQKQTGPQTQASDDIQLPERTLLGRIGRLDLLAEPMHRRDTESTSIRRVTHRKSTHSGPANQ